MCIVASLVATNENTKIAIMMVVSHIGTTYVTHKVSIEG